VSISRTLYNREWRHRNKDKVRANRKRYDERHRDRINEQRRKREAKNRSYYNLKSHNAYLKGRENYLKTAREKNRKIRLEAINILGGKCVKCGFKDWRALQIDHVKGEGMKERKKTHCSSSYYRKVFEEIKNGSDKYQLLCANCNWIKRYENNEVSEWSKY